MIGPRGRAWSIASVVLLTLVVAASILLPIPFVSHSPGPVFDVLGEVDGQPVLAISDARTYPTTGSMDLTTVSEVGGASGPMSVGSALWSLFDPNASVLPDDQPHSDQEQDYEKAVFDSSQSYAVGAAANFLDRPVRVRAAVIEVVSGSAADGVLEPGDVILAINGQPVRDASEVRKIVQDQPMGTTFNFLVRRGGETKRVQAQSRPAEEDPDRPVVGVAVDNQYTSDFTPTINLPDIGGPSAGLIFSLAMVDELTPGDLLAGKHIAGTGEISAEGRVGPIGGIDKKILGARSAGAELFLAPVANCPDLPADPGLTVAPVSTLAEAVDAVEAWNAGRPLPTCPSVSADSQNG